jgi:hypothetical protein
MKANIDVWAPIQALYQLGNYQGWPQDFTIADKQKAREFFAREQAAGKQLWTYQCSGPTKAMDVNSYYRQYPWRAWYYGNTGLGIWSYNDIRGASSWSDVDRADFSLIYEHRDAPEDIPVSPVEPLIPSRRWQVFRTAVQDYLLLSMLQRRGVPVEQLRGIVRQVLESCENPESFSQARTKLLGLL